MDQAAEMNGKIFKKNNKFVTFVLKLYNYCVILLNDGKNKPERIKI